MRFFNTAGPNMPELHYCIPALERLDLDEVLRLVRDKKYFMLHAPRQTGKTSVLFALQGLLTRQGYHCLYVTVEEAGTGLEDVEQAVRTVLDSLAYAARDLLGDPFLSGVWVGILAESGPKRALRIALQEWAKASPKPLVLLIDEIDALQGETLFSVLQQLRAGYSWRSEAFPQSVVLCGMRDVRNYRSTGSPFNIVAKSLRLGDFSQEETLALLGQHTAETGQAFTSEAQETVWEQTLGQPWLVNALAQEVCFESAAGRERSRAVTGDDIADARERLILGRVTHRSVDLQAGGRSCAAGDRATVERRQPPRRHRARHGILAGSRPDRERCADAHRQSDLCRGDPARTDFRGSRRDRARRCLVRRCRRWTRHDEPDGGVPDVLPRKFGALEGPLRVPGGLAAASVAGVSATGAQRRRTYRAGIRVGPGAHRSADRLAEGQRCAEVRDRVQDAAREPGGDHRRGTGAGCGLHGPLRGGDGPLGDLRPRRKEALEREGFPPLGIERRDLGHVAGGGGQQGVAVGSRDGSLQRKPDKTARRDENAASPT